MAGWEHRRRCAQAPHCEPGQKNPGGSRPPARPARRQHNGRAGSQRKESRAANVR
jgi:hypothetical protein